MTRKPLSELRRNRDGAYIITQPGHGTPAARAACALGEFGVNGADVREDGYKMPQQEP